MSRREGVSSAPGDVSIAFDGAGKRFGDDWVVHDVDLHVRHGEILGLIGPSGCGKTTTVRLATGFHRPDAGTVRLLGADPTRLSAARRRDVGYLAQTPVLFEQLSLWENLNFHASLNGVRLRRRRRLEQLLDLVDLRGEERKLVAESSGGMQRRLALAAAMVHAPRVLMLDEPTAGIDPILRRRFWEHFRALGDAGTTVVITTQFVEEAAYCDTVGMLAGGRLAALDSPQGLRRLAFGGQVIDVEFDRPVTSTLVDALRAQAGLGRVELHDDRVIRLAVDTDVVATSEVTALVEATDPSPHPTARIVSVAEVATDWNDVFIELVGAHR